MIDVEKTSREPRSKVQILINRMRRDFQLQVFCILPLMETFSEDVEWLAKTANIPLEKAAAQKKDLLDSGLWIRNNEGRIKTRQDRLGLGEAGSAEMKSAEFLTMSAQMYSFISPEGPCWYEGHTVVTSLELKKQFVTRMNEVLQDFLKASEKAKGETMISWSHVAFDSLTTLQQQETDK